MEIATGSIVKYQNGFYRVTRCTKNTINLGAIFGNRVYHKGLNKNEVTEALAEWHERWINSESYKSM